MNTTDRTPQVTDVEVPRTHVLRVFFDDDLVRELEYQPDTARPGGVFEAFADPAFFAAVSVDHGTLVWPNGVDLDPDVLHGDFAPAGPERFKLIAQYAVHHAK